MQVRIKDESSSFSERAGSSTAFIKSALLRVKLFVTPVSGIKGIAIIHHYYFKYSNLTYQSLKNLSHVYEICHSRSPSIF